jgi:Uma2 family endonuclease
MTTAAVATEKRITEEELLRLAGEDQQVEVVNGELVYNMSAAYLDHALYGARVYAILYAYLTEHNLGFVHGDNVHYKLDEDAQGLKDSRIPDVAFVRWEHVPPGYDFHGLFPGAPDLAVEVVSETESQDETRGKIQTYLKYGTEQVWVLYPNWGEVHVYTSADPKTIRIYSGDDVLTAEALFPGLEIVVSKFFELPSPPK